MAGKTTDNADLFAFGKQFWDTWTGFAQDTLRGATPQWGAPAEVFARAVPESMSDAAHAAGSMAEQGRQFMQFLQSMAARMGGGEALDAQRVSELWRGALGDGNPLLEALRAVNTEGARGWEQAGRGLLELLEPMRAGMAAQLELPTFGYSRERQQHWQALQQASGEHLRAQSEYNALLLKASQRGLEYFESKLAERSEPGRQVDSARALYDLWVDAAEEAYAEVAMSPQFRKVYADLVNTQMRLRQQIQREVEQQTAQLGLPTRSELDGTHRRIHQLSRELRELRSLLARRDGGSGAAEPASPPAATPKPVTAPKAKSKPKAEAKAETTATKAPAKTARRRAK